MTLRWLRLPAVVMAAVLVQLAVLSELTVAGVHADLLMLMGIAAGLVSGPERGAVVGFVCGLVADLFLQTPAGLSALAFCLVGFAVGSFQAGLLRAAWWIPPLTALVASAAGVVLFVALGAVVGQAHLIDGRLPLVIGVVAALNAVLALPVVALVAGSGRGGAMGAGARRARGIRV
ncbi:MAG: rod shape-determining protein MreD [Acidimicrobiales bacterium]